ncbi:MAG: dicarboxylate/amino acid:cation symporter [Chitinophagales bacterium]|nr:dicarboxylate/amino acid:cation symporter [Chitinophagales bacterium]
MKKLALHWQIIIGMAAGIAVGSIAVRFEEGTQWVVNWLKPWGTIFINMLKLIAIPLIITSLIKGIADLKDITQLSKLGIRTFSLYIITTVTAVTIGLVLVNTVKPGKFVSEKTRTDMLSSFSDKATEKVTAANAAQSKGPLQPLVDVVPDNFFGAASSNGNMLQVIFFVIFFGIGLILIPPDKAQPVKAFFEGSNEVILKIIDIIMLFAPIGVFGLLAALVAESPSADIFVALGAYALTVVVGLGLLVLFFYPLLVKFFAGKQPLFFLKGIAPAQLVAFSTSSSAATLPVTIERVEEHLGVEKEVSSFVLPIGATVNMDGTSLYQAVAAVFIAQVLGNDLTLADQLTIILTATLASIGAAAVPGAGLLMLIVVLEAIGVNPAGVALIIAVDRPLDMCRTVANVTSDASVSMIIAKQLGKLRSPHPQEWDDNYKKKN